MTIKEAIFILDPKTTVQAIAELENKEMTREEVEFQVKVACEVACDVMKTYLELIRNISDYKNYSNEELGQIIKGIMV
ncbi:hypothetical protein [uncultured Eubacterium sp.]|uniref:hypothetical protein n=1 Tax=uncultured Eubacterium sp. TaxID=165185 RepID=UPI0025935B4F|nr:hypothetical protein [uncultured Eubacterium sp.]